MLHQLVANSGIVYRFIFGLFKLAVLSSLPPVRAPLMCATAGVPTLPAFTSDSVRAAGSSPSAVHHPIIPMSSQCTASPTDVSTGRHLASHLTSDGDSRRQEIRLGKRPLEEVHAAIVAAVYTDSSDDNFPAELGNTIEGSLLEKRMEQFKDKLEEGKVYKLESFMVVDPRPNYRATDHCYRLRISQNTKINEILPEPENFPLYAYDAKSFDDVRPRVDKPDILSDVVGVVTMVSDVIPSKSGDQSRRHIYIKK
ncbi:hypothetical protein QYE76_068663 [Lolium multiflorum]|uniref:Replication protein A 70 kDa DNA-binding subunit B/D first OB fold domain-containing protein n=1 Tax=Lolium multiflorum TaxID=4521 RepID=A0AAD8SFX6_LOLMU|nr:hypothetical protein QYE76_068663 [Lolium multiflorum]